ncbi:MAG TPA: hypothetical protein VKB53_12460 [Gammaproteobacteria bacterium]|nr:hypothetical protein [Gammaproteobacteria bacterium]
MYTALDCLGFGRHGHNPRHYGHGHNHAEEQATHGHGHTHGVVDPTTATASGTSSIRTPIAMTTAYANTRAGKAATSMHTSIT